MHILTKYVQSEIQAGCAQSGLCKFNSVVAAVVKRHIYKGKRSVSFHHHIANSYVGEGIRANSPGDDR